MKPFNQYKKVRRLLVSKPKPCAHKTVMSLDSIGKRLCYDCRELIDQ